MRHDAQRDAQRSLDRTLTNGANERALELEYYFSRARSIVLLTANVPAFADFYKLPGSRLDRVKRHGEVVAETEQALAYLETLYPNSIGEACFIDRSGWENARIVKNEAAAPADLGNELENAFVRPTFALRPGQVLQARPYVSPDTKEWVISNSTPVAGPGGSKPAIVHFEVTIESFRKTAAASTHNRVFVVDARTGAIVLDSRLPQRVGAQLGRPGDRRFASLQGRAGRGLVDVDGMRVAYRRLPSTVGNQNQWIVAVAADPVAGGGLGIGLGALAALLGVVLLAAIALGFRWLRLTEDLGEGRQALRATEQRFAAIVESSDDAITSVTMDGIVTSWNAGAERLYGYRAEEVLGQPIASIIPDDRSDEWQAIKASLDTDDHVRTFETERVHKNGTYVPVSLTISPIKDAEGRTIGSSGIARDITEQKRAEAELERLLDREREQNIELRSVDTMKDEFIALVSHELRTPLTSIRGYLELVTDAGAGELSAEQRHFLDVVARNAERLQSLVGDLLFIAQIEAGRLNLERDEIELARVAAESIETGKPLARAKGVELSLVAEPVGSLIGDRVRIGQLLDNFVSNAIKFTPVGGSVTVRLAQTNGAAVLEVADTGMGIPADEQERLFERFFRSSTATAQAIQGTGLGLTISKAIADAHGGRITFTSVENEGTTFRIELPLAGRLEEAA
jgi:PAS domain S-box-containing protein